MARGVGAALLPQEAILADDSGASSACSSPARPGPTSRSIVLTPAGEESAERPRPSRRWAT